MPGHNGIHRFWFKKFTTIHDRLALKMNSQDLFLTNKMWMRNRKKTAKDPEAQENYSILISTSSTRARQDTKI